MWTICSDLGCVNEIKVNATQKQGIPQWIDTAHLVNEHRRSVALQWRHISVMVTLDRFFNNLFRLTAKQTPKFCIAFLRAIHRCLMDSPHKGPAMRKAFRCHNIFMEF